MNMRIPKKPPRMDEIDRTSGRASARGGRRRSSHERRAPTTLPDGHEVELCVLNDDGMSEEARQPLHASITRGIRDGRAGREMDLDSFMDQLDAEP